MNIEYVNRIPKPDVVEMCHFNLLQEWKYYFWEDGWFDKCGAIEETVCIWRIKYKK